MAAQELASHVTFRIGATSGRDGVTRRGESRGSTRRSAVATGPPRLRWGMVGGAYRRDAVYRLYGVLFAPRPGRDGPSAVCARRRWTAASRPHGSCASSARSPSGACRGRGASPEPRTLFLFIAAASGHHLEAAADQLPQGARLRLAPGSAARTRDFDVDAQRACATLACATSRYYGTDRASGSRRRAGSHSKLFLFDEDGVARRYRLRADPAPLPCFAPYRRPDTLPWRSCGRLSPSGRVEAIAMRTLRRHRCAALRRRRGSDVALRGCRERRLPYCDTDELARSLAPRLGSRRSGARVRLVSTVGDPVRALRPSSRSR